MTADDIFLQQFENQTLPFAQWTHRAHVKVAYLYLTRLDFDTAAQKVCDGIRAYNAANNVPESPTSGYHHTTTMAWLHIIATTIAEWGPAATSDEFLDNQPQLTQKRMLRLSYSRERFRSPEAKDTFVEPDLTALPIKGSKKGI
jgi:hypothetical protein